MRPAADIYGNSYPRDLHLLRGVHPHRNPALSLRLQSFQARGFGGRAVLVRSGSLCALLLGHRGAILLHSHNPYLGLDAAKLLGDQMTVLFTLAMVLVGTGPAIGAIAERGRFVLVPPLAALLSVIVIPIVGHWTWYGLLAKFGGVDIGGALPIILAPAVVGIVAAAMVGPRSNKYNRDGSANAVPGHNAVLAAGGIGLLLAGWLAYLILAAFVWANVGLWRTLLDGILAACAGMLVR